VSACFSKGLGAPVGSVIAGTRAEIDRALRLRKMFGGAMRQVGVLCAAALYALDRNRARLAEDHENARWLAHGLAEIDGVRVDPASVETNIVIAELTSMPASELCKRAGEDGVRMAPVGPHHVRAVTHLEIDAAGIGRAIDAVRRAIAR
jgi:threonine aldolase